MALFNATDGIHFSDPRKFLKFQQAASQTYLLGVATQRASTAPEFFSAGLAARGFDDDTGWTADTYKTLLNVTGTGVLSTLVGPTALAGTPTTTWEITVDGGAAITIAVTLTTTAVRSILGNAVADTSATGSQFTTAASWLAGSNSINTGKTVQIYSTNSFFIPDFGFMGLMGTPCLEFKASLLVRAKTSETNNTTTNHERRSGGVYRLYV